MTIRNDITAKENTPSYPNRKNKERKINKQKK
jgi:hypothetical protein